MQVKAFVMCVVINKLKFTSIPAMPRCNSAQTSPIIRPEHSDFRPRIITL